MCGDYNNYYKYLSKTAVGADGHTNVFVVRLGRRSHIDYTRTIVSKRLSSPV